MRIDALDTSQAPSALCMVLFLRQSRKTAKNAIILKKKKLLRVSLYFSKTVPCTELKFFALHSAHQDASFDLSQSTYIFLLDIGGLTNCFA